MSADNKRIEKPRYYGSPSKIQGMLGLRSESKISKGLFSAIARGDVETFKDLLDHDLANVNAINPYFDGIKPSSDIQDIPVGEVTLLMYAVMRGRFDIVKILLEKKPDLNSKNDKGETALMIASDKEGEDFPMTELLVAAGADIELTDKHDNNVLTIALANEEFRKARVLLKAVTRERRRKLLDSELNKSQYESVVEFLKEEIEAANYEKQRKPVFSTITEEEWDSLDGEKSSAIPSTDDSVKLATRTHANPHKSPHKSPNRRKRKIEEDSASASSDGATSLEESSSEDATRPIVRTHSSPSKRSGQEAEKESLSDSSSTYSNPSKGSKHKKARDVADFWLRRNQVGLDEGLMLAEQATGIVLSENSQALADVSTHIKAGSGL